MTGTFYFKKKKLPVFLLGHTLESSRNSNGTNGHFTFSNLLRSFG